MFIIIIIIITIIIIIIIIIIMFTIIIITISIIIIIIIIIIAKPPFTKPPLCELPTLREFREPGFRPRLFRNSNDPHLGLINPLN